jgi:hypothetical protein
MLPEPEPSALSFRDRFPKPTFMTLTVAVALLVTPSVGLLAAELRDPNAERARLAQEADRALRADLLEQGFTSLDGKTADVSSLGRIGIEVITPERSFQLESGALVLSGEPAPVEQRKLALATLASELGRYPAPFLARARLHRLVLCAKLQEGNEPIPSLPNYHGALLVDVAADAPYLRRLVHHEVFHFADYADDDQLSHDPAWLGLNDRYFVYGSGGRFLREPGAGRFTAEIPGFVSRYATSALEEDKAEIFAMRMSAPRQFAKLTAADPIMRAKSAALEAQLQRLSPTIDQRFFAAIDQR